MWITIAIPSTTPRHVTSHGRSPPPCIAQLAKSGEGTLRVVGVDGGERAAVAGVEGLQEVGGFAAAHFADDDVIGSVAQGVTHQVADRDRAVLQPARLEADASWGESMRSSKVSSIADDPLVVGDEFDEGIEERRLAAAGAAAHENVAPGVQRLFRRRADVLG